MPTAKGIFSVPEMSNDRRVRIFRRIFAAPGEFEGMEVDTYVVITRRYLIVCDTLLCPEDMASVIHAVYDELAGRQLLVINSHADWDHIYGNSYFTGEQAAPIIAHEHCLTRIQSEDTQMELQEFQRRYPLFHNVVLIPPTITFSNTLTIHGGDLTVELLAAPGHQRDHVVAWLPELSLLLAFDAVEKPLPLIESATSIEPMLATLERLLAMQPQYVLCSHSKATSVQTIRENLAYLHEIERRSRILLTTRHPTSSELEHAARLIDYPFDEVVAEWREPVDRAFYAQEHDHNVRCVIEWLTVSHP